MKSILRLNAPALLASLLLTVLVSFAPASYALGRADDEKAPAARRTAVLRGRASWYGKEHQGLRTSSGERFDRNQYTCAHKTLPFGTRLRVTNPATGKAVVVRVSDRGPFRHQRILDLAEIAARPLGIVQHGAVSVVAEIVPSTTPLGPTGAPANLASLATDSVHTLTATTILPGATEATDVVVVPEPKASFVVQAGTFGDVRNAQAVLDKILALDRQLAVSMAAGFKEGKPVSRVLVGGFPDRAEAEKLRLRLQQWGINGLVRQSENL